MDPAIFHTKHQHTVNLEAAAGRRSRRTDCSWVPCAVKSTTGTLPVDEGVPSTSSRKRPNNSRTTPRIASRPASTRNRACTVPSSVRSRQPDRSRASLCCRRASGTPESRLASLTSLRGRFPAHPRQTTGRDPARSTEGCGTGIAAAILHGRTSALERSPASQPGHCAGAGLPGHQCRRDRLVPPAPQQMPHADSVQEVVPALRAESTTTRSSGAEPEPAATLRSPRRNRQRPARVHA
jgi:hypothetical protein